MEGIVMPMVIIRKGLLYRAHPIVVGHDPDCSDPECAGSTHLGAPVAAALTSWGLDRKVYRYLARLHAQHRSDAARAASEALGG